MAQAYKSSASGDFLRALIALKSRGTGASVIFSKKFTDSVMVDFPFTADIVLRPLEVVFVCYKKIVAAAVCFGIVILTPTRRNRSTKESLHLVPETWNGSAVTTCGL